MIGYQEVYTLKFKHEIINPDGTARLLDAPFIVREMVSEEELDKSNCPSGIRVRIITHLASKLMEKLMDEYA